MSCCGENCIVQSRELACTINKLFCYSLCELYQSIFASVDVSVRLVVMRLLWYSCCQNFSCSSSSRTVQLSVRVYGEHILFEIRVGTLSVIVSFFPIFVTFQICFICTHLSIGFPMVVF